MGLLDIMENESDCIESIFQSYISSKSKKDIFLFFEGKDDFKYYVSRVSSHIGDKEYGVFHCNCKMNVLTIQEMIANQAAIQDDKKNLYFIDRDYDDNENIPDSIYVTSSYSIENNYFTNSAIKRILIGVIGISEENEDDNLDFKVVYNHITSIRDKIIEEIIYANAWYSLQIKKSKHSVEHTQMSNLKEYSNIKNICQIQVLEKLVKNSLEINESEINKEIENLRLNPVSKIRGKYFTQALTPVFRDVFQDAGKKYNRKYFSKKRKIHANLSDIISELSAYADTPPELISYIRERLSV
ncbi:DUF4435 domain-containing protein [Peptoniphilus sp. Marseille-Q6390]